MKKTNQIPAVIIRCLQKVRKVRFTVAKAQIFPILTYGDCIIFISTYKSFKSRRYEDWCQKEILSSAVPENNSLFDLQTLSQEKIV